MTGWRCLTFDHLGMVVRTEFFDDAAEAEAHAKEHEGHGFVCAVSQGALDDDGTFVPVGG